jgi:hypothetical protein
MNAAISNCIFRERGKYNIVKVISRIKEMIFEPRENMSPRKAQEQDAMANRAQRPIFERWCVQMRYLRILAAAIFVAAISVGAKADNDEEDNSLYGGDAPHVDVWTNKGYDANYYFGEDVAVYFRADQDCYVVVYDVDPSGEVTVLYPNSMNGSTYASSDQVYRIPDTNDDFKMEVSGASGREHIYAVASYDFMNPPDFMKYIGYDYGGDQYYDNKYFITAINGNVDDYADQINHRLANGAYSVAHTRFLVDTSYRHHQHYRYWDYGPYDVGSVWVGAAWPGCEVWIDGVYYGIAPVLIPQVIIGYHWVWIYYGGYPCYQRYFYASAHRRFDIDARFDSRFKDYRYGRDHFRGWVFEQKRYRNEPNFGDQVKPIREKHIRERSLPPSVIRDYADRGVIAKDAPLVKKVRIDTPDRSRIGADKPDQITPNQPGRVNINNGEKDIRGRQSQGIEKPGYQTDNPPKVIVPEKPRAPQEDKPVVRESRPDKVRQVEKHESNSSDIKKYEKVSRPSQGSSRENISGPAEKPRQTESISKPAEKSRESHPEKGNNGGTVERQKSGSNDKGSNEKESRTSGGKSSRRR